MLSTTEFKLHKELEIFGKDPENVSSNIRLAKIYFDTGQYASSISFLNRIAELSLNSNEVYEALCLAAECFLRIGDRKEHIKVCASHAISTIPDRPEAYYYMSYHYEQSGDSHGAYANACTGLKFKKNAKDSSGLNGVFLAWRLYYQKGLNSWGTHRVQQAKIIFYDLYHNYDLDPEWKDNVKFNLDNIGWPHPHHIPDDIK